MRAHQRRALETAPGAERGLPAPFSLGPAAWIAGPGAWARGAAELARWPQPLGLVGETGLLRGLRRALAPALLDGTVEVKLLDLADGADCTDAAAEDLEGRCRALGLGSLAALGGGRVLDLAKRVRARLGVPLAALPTSAATCACATSVAVVNGPGGGYARVEALPAAPDLVLVETPVLRLAPPRLLAAGLADTLAKWLEWRALEEAPGAFGAGAGWALAKAAAEACRACGADAVALPGGPAFDAALEACLLWSGLASCAGRAPAAAAHSLADALSLQAPGRALLHGEAVGLGLLWQEGLLADAGSATMGVEPLGRLLTAWGLPTRLPAGLDLDRLVVDAFAEDETVHALTADPLGARRRLDLLADE